MGPLTRIIPKEMFPLGSIPVIEHTIAELASSGIERIGVVIRKGKEMIREYLDTRRDLYPNSKLEFVYQKEALGLGGALRCAKDFIRGVPFVMAIPDQILISEQYATRQLLEVCESVGIGGIWNCMVQIRRSEMAFFEGSRPLKYKKGNGRFFLIEDISADLKSRVKGFGRTVFLPEALDYMSEEFVNDKTDEVDLLKTFHALKGKFRLLGFFLKGRPCDVGTWEGYYFYQQRILRSLKAKEKAS
jgi:UTP--glucose-1-phosphate uridylyltransferase